MRMNIFWPTKDTWVLHISSIHIKADGLRQIKSALIGRSVEYVRKLNALTRESRIGGSPVDVGEALIIISTICA
jgi:hypothetical protein